jgi:hypothetical protein
MAEPLKQTRQDPLVKKEISERFKEVVERSGLDPSVINFRCGWKARTRINNYISGTRTPGAQELIELDKVLYPILGEYVSFYILHGKHASDIKDGVRSGGIKQASVNRALTGLLNDYVEMGRLVAEPKLTTSKILSDFNEFYLPREVENDNRQES